MISPSSPSLTLPVMFVCVPARDLPPPMVCSDVPDIAVVPAADEDPADEPIDIVADVVAAAAAATGNCPWLLVALMNDIVRRGVLWSLLFLCTGMNEFERCACLREALDDPDEPAGVLAVNAFCVAGVALLMLCAWCGDWLGDDCGGSCGEVPDPEDATEEECARDAPAEDWLPSMLGGGMSGMEGGGMSGTGGGGMSVTEAARTLELALALALALDAGDDPCSCWGDS